MRLLITLVFMCYLAGLSWGECLCPEKLKGLRESYCTSDFALHVMIESNKKTDGDEQFSDDYYDMKIIGNYLLPEHWNIETSKMYTPPAGKSCGVELEQKEYLLMGYIDTFFDNHNRMEITQCGHNKEWALINAVDKEWLKKPNCDGINVLP